jgi:tight adherence protein C
MYIVIGAILLIVVILLVVVGLRDNQKVDPLQARLAEYAAKGLTTDLEQIELSQPLTDRVIFPIARRLGELALRITPQNAIQQTAHKLELAGNPGRLDPTLFWALRMGGMCLGVALFFVAMIAPEGSFLKGRGLLVAILPALGFFLPA